MNNNEMQTFFLNVSQLIERYEQLKRYTFKLHEENDVLKKENNALKAQNGDAKTAFHQIIDQLKELQ